jgi:hypothetical protein
MDGVVLSSLSSLDAMPQLGYVQRRSTHFCISCSFPIATYGRLYPCLHTYCLVCATDMERCNM